MTKTIAGITYALPKVTLMHTTPLLIGEYAGRTAYDSFSNSEHESIRDQNPLALEADSSKLLTSLAWVHHHHSVLEHLSINYLIEGISRGVLQEVVRHRIASYTVRSTRYTMQNILHAFNACSVSSIQQAKYDFTELIKSMNMFVVQDVAETVEIHAMYDKLHHQLITLGSDAFTDLTMSKSAKEVYSKRLSPHKTSLEVFRELTECKSKRNVGDAMKWIVTDNWKVDMVVTFNLRSLKNYLGLRDSRGAYFQIRHLAQAMKEVTPKEYLNLIVKD